LIQPSIEKARSGIIPPDHLIEALKSRVTDKTWKVENDSIMKRLMKSAYSTELLQNPKLADALENISANGAKVFYEGAIGEQIVAAVKRAEGILTKYDMSGYKIRWEQPLNITWDNYTIITSGPPSSGLGVLLTLSYLKLNDDAKQSQIDSADAYHLMMEAMKKSLMDVAGLGDPNFVSYVQNRTKWHLLPKTLEVEAKHIRKSHTLFPKEEFPFIPEPVSTQVMVMDDDDLYVSLVFGLNSYFGSRVDAGGFFLNNAMGNFFLPPRGGDLPNDGYCDASEPTCGQSFRANFVEPNKRPLSLSAPILIVSSSHMCKMRLLSGGPSFDVISQVLANYLIFDKPLPESVNAPRLHVGQVFGTKDYLAETQEPLIPEAVYRRLESKGLTFSVIKAPYSSCSAIVKREDVQKGAADPRTSAAVSDF
jgi:gamma-glutamyltranspeptidase/glutathione hydrolase